jgi:hypothetical protein
LILFVSFCLSFRLSLRLFYVFLLFLISTSRNNTTNFLSLTQQQLPPLQPPSSPPQPPSSPPQPPSSPPQPPPPTAQNTKNVNKKNVNNMTLLREREEIGGIVT